LGEGVGEQGESVWVTGKDRWFGSQGSRSGGDGGVIKALSFSSRFLSLVSVIPLRRSTHGQRHMKQRRIIKDITLSFLNFFIDLQVARLFVGSPSQLPPLRFCQANILTIYITTSDTIHSVSTINRLIDQ